MAMYLGIRIAILSNKFYILLSPAGCIIPIKI
jgi:hypothetical protein